MNLKSLLCVFLLVLIVKNAGCQQNNLKTSLTSVDYLAALRDTLTPLSEKSENEFFRTHCKSIPAVMNSKYSLKPADSVFLINTYKAFIKESDPARKYLSGHSMGGYGAWGLARKKNPA